MDLHMFMPMIEEMRKELTRVGFQELKTPEQVSQTLPTTRGVALVAVNSVCGCAGGIARPGVAMALASGAKPDHLYTVFAGQDKEATATARALWAGYPPSSPSFAVMKDGQIVAMVHRSQIEGNSPQAVAQRLSAAIEAARA